MLTFQHNFYFSFILINIVIVKEKRVNPILLFLHQFLYIFIKRSNRIPQINNYHYYNGSVDLID
jgi:hypothetical protein